MIYNICMSKSNLKIMLATPTVKIGNVEDNATQMMQMIELGLEQSADFIVFANNVFFGNTMGHLLEKNDEPTIFDDTAKAVDVQIKQISKRLTASQSTCTVIFSGWCTYRTSVQNCLITLTGHNVNIMPSKKSHTYSTVDGVSFCSRLGNKYDHLVTEKTPKCQLNIILDNGLYLANSKQFYTDKVAYYSQLNQNTTVLISSGKGESISVGVHNGAKLVAQKGELISQEWLDKEYSFVEVPNIARPEALDPKAKPYWDNTQQPLSPLPFVTEYQNCWDDVWDILKYGTYQRVKEARAKGIIVGVSGGIDSANILVLASEIAKQYPDFGTVYGVTMHTDNTSKRSNDNSKALIEACGAVHIDIPIGDSVAQHLKAIGHKGEFDTTYENAHARRRTAILLDLANMHGVMHLGTGDMSEIALGWSTYGGDQLSHFNPNANLTKTMLRALLPHVSKKLNKKIHEIVIDIVNAPVSPELLPNQKTEEILGPYEFYDFVLYHLVFKNQNIASLIDLCYKAFPMLPQKLVLQYIKTFLNRFFSNSFKRLYACDGIQVTDYDLGKTTIRADFDPGTLLLQLSVFE